jgi:DNA-binding NtrC family response regulator
MPAEDDGLRLLKWIQETRPGTRTIIITVHAATARVAVEAIREGASDYLVMSPNFPDELSEAVEKAFEETEEPEVPPAGEESDRGFGRLLGTSPAMREVYSAIRQAGESAGLPVLIEGAPGTGKELAARSVHEADRERRGHPFIALHCGSVTAEALHEEIFGPGRTGDGEAGVLSKGWLGSLYLEEVDRTSPRLQVDLLRLLETGEVAFSSGRVARLGRGRVLCGTSADLDGAVAAGEFRPDLLSRLRILSIRLPALCDRKEDIDLLARHFITEFCAEANRPEPDLTEGALEILREVRWPENVRELRGVIERALVCFPHADELGEDAILEVLGGAEMHSSVLGTA